MESLFNIIQNFGFPVFAFVCAGLGCKYTYDKETTQSEKENERNREERIELEKRLESITTSLIENTSSIKNLTETVLKLVEKK